VRKKEDGEKMDEGEGEKKQVFLGQGQTLRKKKGEGK